MVSKKPAEPGMSSDGLTSNPWQVVAVGKTEVEVTPGQEATMEFDPAGETVSGSGGCNRYAGSYEVAGASLTFGRIRSTMMACPDGRMDLEQAFLRNLEAATRVFLRGDALELENDAGVVMVFAAWEGSE